MKVLYTLAGQILTADEFNLLFTPCDVNLNPDHRDELRGQPIVRSLDGPMWGGYHTDGTPIIRYEFFASWFR